MILICIKIFLARILDVSLGTIRTVLIVHGSRLKGAILAFFEVFIWFLIAREALNTSFSSMLIPIFYAGGYAFGTYLGTILADTLLDVLIEVTIITKRDLTKRVLELIRNDEFRVSVVNLENPMDNILKDMLICTINKKNLKKIKNIVNNIDSQAFVMVNEIKYAQSGLK